MAISPTTQTPEQTLFLNRLAQRIDAYLNDGAEEPELELYQEFMAAVPSIVIGLELIVEEIQHQAALAADSHSYCKSQVFETTVRPLIAMVFGPAAQTGSSMAGSLVAYYAACAGLFLLLPPCNGCEPICIP